MVTKDDLLYVVGMKINSFINLYIQILLKVVTTSQEMKGKKSTTGGTVELPFTGTSFEVAILEIFIVKEVILIFYLERTFN